MNSQVSGSKIRVALLAPLGSTSEWGGVAVHVSKLVEYLSYRDDVELHIVTFGDENKQFRKGNLNVYMVRMIKLPFVPFTLSVFQIRPLKRKIEEINPDIVHAEGSFAPYSTAAALVRSKYPTLLTVLGVVRMQIKFYKGVYLIFALLIHRPNEKYVISRIRHIIVQSPYTKNLVSRMTNSKIYFIPEGIEFEKLQNIPPHNEKPDVFLPVALIRLKGVDVLIKALPEVIKSVPDLKVYVAGAGEEEQELKSMASDLGLGIHIKFLGHISDEEEINRYYKACKIVVVPSRWDVDPFAPLYAAALGKPVIVSDMCNSSVAEDGKTGFVFKSEDIEGLSSKMVKLLTDDKLREEMGKAAMEKARENDWARIAERKVAIYREVIADFHQGKL